MEITVIISREGTKIFVLAASRTTATQTIESIVKDILLWQKEHHHQQQYRSDSDSGSSNNNHNNNNNHRPFVTLTYAQSVDGKIALLLNDNNNSSSSSNFALSGPESLRMTHALRSVHDAVLIGGKTLSVDNPRLNNRLWKSTSAKQPRPVVLDTHLKYVRKLLGKHNARNIVVCCSHDAAAAAAASGATSTTRTTTPAVNDDDDNGTEQQQSTMTELELLPCDLDLETGKIDLMSMLQQLKSKYAIQSVMVEGGATVLTAFYKNHHFLVDCICITIAPKLLLWQGLSGILDRNNNAIVVPGEEGRGNDDHIILDKNDGIRKNLGSCKFLLLGSDSIFLGKIVR